MTNTLPYSRVVDVNVSRNDRFPTRRGFGTGLLLTTVAIAGILDADNRTKIYANMDEVAADHSAVTEVYAGMATAFAQENAPLRMKVGFTGALTDANSLSDAMDEILDADQDFYAVLITQSMRDQDYLDGLVSWIETRSKVALIDSNDVLLQDATDTTNIAARHKGTVERTAIFYHTEVSANLAAAAWAYMATRNLDQANSAYTVKFKPANTINNVKIGVAGITAVTGFVEGIGQSEAAGHLANTLVDIGQQNFITEGSVLRQNVFLDEIHMTDWLVARTEEETLAMFLNNAVIPMTNQGMQQIAAVPRSVMAQGVRSGIVAQDLNPLTGDYEPAYTIDVPDVFDIQEAQRKSRISPVIAVKFRAAGAVHFTTINYAISF